MIGNSRFSMISASKTKCARRSICCCARSPRFLDLSGVRRKLAPYYSDMGRPSLDPELMIRMLLVGYLYGTSRSERRLVEEVHLNLAYRWFCGLGLTGEVPERSSFSKTRHGRDSARAMPSVWCSRVCCKPLPSRRSRQRRDVRHGCERHDEADGARSAVHGRCDAAGELERSGQGHATGARISRPAGQGRRSWRAPRESPETAEVAIAARSTSGVDQQRPCSKIAFARYGTNYLIDTKAAIIVDVGTITRALDGGSGGDTHND